VSVSGFGVGGMSVSGFGVGWGETGGVSGIPVVDVRHVGEDGVPVATTLDKADVVVECQPSWWGGIDGGQR
jgi:hypothetical protein